MVRRGKQKPNKRRPHQSPIKRALRVLRLSITTGLGIVGVLAMSVVLVFVYDMVTQTDVFSAQALEIEGNRRMTRADILHQAQLKKKVNIFSVNLPLSRKRLLSHPWIAEAEVSRIPPDGLKIRIREHTPVALVVLDHTYVLNANGELFKRLTQSDPKRLPEIVGLEFADIHVPGGKMSPPFKAVMDVIRLGKGKTSVLPNGKLRTIVVDREVGLSLVAKPTEMKIELGYGKYPEKYKVLSKVLSYLKHRSEFETVRTISVKNMNRVVVNAVRQASNGKDKKEA